MSISQYSRGSSGSGVVEGQALSLLKKVAWTSSSTTYVGGHLNRERETERMSEIAFTVIKIGKILA